MTWSAFSTRAVTLASSPSLALPTTAVLVREKPAQQANDLFPSGGIAPNSSL